MERLQTISRQEKKNLSRGLQTIHDEKGKEF
jgi:hypothetical protein